MPLSDYEKDLVQKLVELSDKIQAASNAKALFEERTLVLSRERNALIDELLGTEAP